MKNLKVGKKFIVSFGSILLLFLISVVAAGIGISKAKTSYHQFYTEEYGAVLRIDQIRLNLQGALKELMLGVVSTDPQDTAERMKNVDACMTNIQTNLQWIYDNYEGDVSLLREFESKRQANASVRKQVVEYASLATDEGNQKAIEIVLNQYNPQVEEYTVLLEQAFADIEKKSEEAYQSSMRMQSLLLGASIAIAAVAFIFTCLIALDLTKNILVPVKTIEDSMKEVVKGNLSVEVKYDAQDEFGDMAHNMHVMTTSVGSIIRDIEHVLSAMASGDFTVTSMAKELYIGDYQKIFTSMRQIRDSLSGTLLTLNQSADQVSSGSDQVSSGAQALSQGATEQASSVEELAASISEISNNINRNAAGAQEASQKSMEVGAEAGESNRRMHDMLSAMSEINASSGEIGKIIKTIEDIAFQTNILALNAAVEAARAGAAGKGFAVVADEVRNLASKSADASKNTAVLIENSLHAVENGKKIADETAKSLESVMAGVQEAAGMMDSIARASKEQADAITQITVGIDQISSVVQTNSATAQESAAASEELSSQAQILKDLVRRFKLLGGGSSGYTPAPAASAPAAVSDKEEFYYGGNDKY